VEVVFQKCLAEKSRLGQQSDISGEKASTTKFEMTVARGLSIERMCQLAQVSERIYRPLTVGS